MLGLYPSFSFLKVQSKAPKTTTLNKSKRLVDFDAVYNKFWVESKNGFQLPRDKRHLKNDSSAPLPACSATPRHVDGYLLVG